MRSHLFRWSLAMSFVLLGAGLPGLWRWGAVAVGAAVFVAQPLVTDALLRRMLRRLETLRGPAAVRAALELGHKRLVAIFAPQALAPFVCGQLFARSGRVQAAFDAFTQALRACGGNDPAIMGCLAHMHLCLGKPVLARTMLEEVRDHATLLPQHQLWLATLLAEQPSAHDEAWSLIEAIADRIPAEHATTYVHARAFVAARTGRMMQVLQTLASAQSLDSDLDPATLDLKRRTKKLLSRQVSRV